MAGIGDIWCRSQNWPPRWSVAAGVVVVSDTFIVPAAVQPSRLAGMPAYLEPKAARLGDCGAFEDVWRVNWFHPSGLDFHVLHLN